MSVNVCIVGALRREFLVKAPRFPRAGETLTGESLVLGVGGKGAQQAVAASRLGARVTLIGALGDDDWGRAVRAALASEGIDLAMVRTIENSPTGAGVVTQIEGGAKTRLIVPGADAALRPEDIERFSGSISDAAILLVQGELPIACTQRAVEIARKASTTVLLDAAPMIEFPHELMTEVDLLVVSRSEAAELVGDTTGEVAPTGLARRLSSLGPERVVVTLRAEGAVCFNGSELEHCDPFPAAGTESSGAGDAFVAALGVFRAEGTRLKDAVRLACAAGSLATTRSGALAGFPSREAVEELARRPRRKT